MINFYKKKLLPLLVILLLLTPLIASAQMTYSSSTVTQNTTKVLSGSINQQVIGIRIVTSGSTNALSVSRFNLSTLGTTRAADISNARIFYTGTSATFAATNQFGTVVAAPNGSFSVTGTRALVAGTNYFWLTYDIPATAVAGNLVDARCTSLIIAGVTRTPSTTAPTGARTIEAPLFNVYTINKTGTGSRNFTSFSAAIAALNANGVANGGVTYQVASGQTFNEAPLTITATGTSANPITFEKSGSAADPILQGTGGVGALDNIITINSGDYITFDGIAFKDNPANTTATTKMEHGIHFNNTATNGSMYNTITNSSITLDKNNTNITYGIFANNTTATSAAGANSYNSFYNNTIQNVAYAVYLNGNNTYYDSGNEIGSETFSNTLTDFNDEAIHMGQQLGAKVFNNNITKGVGTAITGIHVIGPNSSVDIYENNLLGFSTASTTGKLIGIHTEVAASTNIYANTLTNFTATATSTSTATIQAIEVDAGTSNIYNNLISNFNNASTGTGGIVNGILTKGGSTHNVVNNMVSDLRANASAANPSVRAISLEGGTTINLFFNSLHLSGVSTTSSHSSATLYITATPGSVNMRNNILYNNYSVSTGTRAVALFKSSTSYTNIAAASNNNLLFAGTPSAKKLLFYDGTNAVQTLSAYKTRLGPTRESAAVSEDPRFVSATDLHLSSCYTPVKGPAIAGITQDIDGDTRAANPVIGADEVVVGTIISRWLGTVSTDWNNPANWSCNLVPVSTSEVVIPVTGTRKPVITSGSAVAKNITIDHGTTLTINGGSLTVSEDVNLNGTLANNASGTVKVGGTITLNTEDDNVAATVTNNGTLQVSNAMVVNEGNITNNGTIQIATDLTVVKGSGSNFITNYGALNIAQHFSSEAEVNIENAGELVVEGDLTTSAIFLNNGMDGIGSLVVNGKFTNNIEGHFTNFFGVATVTDFYNKALIDGDLGSFAIAGISENAKGAVIKGGIDICDSSREAGKNFVDNNYGLIEWGTFDTDPDDGNVTQCGEEAIFKPLPVTLITWKATVVNGQVVLSWETATEHNSDYYIVERSTDGRNFEKIAQVQAAGNSKQIKSYTYTDKNVLAGTVYYRLKQVDLDEKFTYTGIISKSVRTAPAFNMNVFPNPLSNQEELHIWLTGNAKQHYLIEVIDMQGRLLYQLPIELKTNVQELFIPIRITAKVKGLCIIRCSDLQNNQTQTAKVIVR
ncbi:beta strand repeat-containing protein [Adhaeribacter rhizoryzae]|uniref:Sialidase N-terminal domain-containing protein n=1 Tax=Adhaeribacter rhizoryzae TaxID=2607907 RepID=A0A5M6DJK0_9BACT|nr:BNR-repeat neuraminidase N-terminal domain-containing protein [Adhaeribacter rhizoryzae]KAA5546546.1 hypothetical protein F0145_11725 [Adhaeribacter rhizoryzae]